MKTEEIIPKETPDIVQQEVHEDECLIGQDDKEELFEHFRFEVDKGTALIRIDKYLQNLIPNVSRTKVQQAAKAGCILVNGTSEKQNYRVKPSDVITVLLPNPPKELELVAEDIPIDIAYEDDHLLVVNKQPGLVVHPAYANYTGTLLNALLYHLENKYSPEGEPYRPLLVHRIDKNTSGVMVVAKTELAQLRLSKHFFDHDIDRSYWALVWGDLKEDAGTIEGYIGRHPIDRTIRTVCADSEKGKYAVTHYKVLERFGYVTLVECTLETGRTHQIRVHMRHIGHPLFNDSTYGGNEILKGTTYSKYKQFIHNCFKIMPRQALHAKSLGFIHPATEEHVFFDSILPEDFQTVIEKWRHYIKYRVLDEDNNE
ncbi:MAG: RluA family pseudouridine synthase [Bacteroidales bacterium]|jgi:23S rRNA pseudouridine1911/1915/1917 synthase|nr:RluA family pseudouridine synthase [Bacteroidales bacterium]